MKAGLAKLVKSLAYGPSVAIVASIAGMVHYGLAIVVVLLSFVIAGLASEAE